MIFYFHLYNGDGFTADDEGSEHQSLAAAREAAVEGIRSILSEEVKKGRLSLAGRLELVDEAGEVAMSIPFAETVAIELAGEAGD